MSKNNNKMVYIVALLLFVGGLGYLIVTGLTQDSVYFLNVNEAIAQDRVNMGKVRLFGKVSPANLDRSMGAFGADFDLIDKMDDAKKLRVTYRGTVPDTFKEDVEVIVEGRFDAQGVFTAKTLVTKCPSKYEEQSAEMEAQKG